VSGVSALRTILPPDTVVGVVGGVSDKDFGAYAAAGVRTFGLGSSLYRPGMSAQEVRETALAAIGAYDRAVRGNAV
jgi:2-dehydro-3-deoxyphosphogalactonate aldolase